MRWLLGFFLCSAFLAFGFADGDNKVDEALESAAKLLDFKEGFALFKADGSLHSNGAKWNSAVAFPKDLTAAFIIAPVAQASVDAAIAFAKSHPDMQIVLRDLALYTGIHEPDQDKSDKIFQDVLAAAEKLDPIDVSKVPPNLELSFVADEKDGTLRASNIAVALEKEIDAVGAQHFRGKNTKATLIQLQAAVSAKTRISVSARARLWHRTNDGARNGGWKVYECTHYPYRDIHFTRSPNRDRAGRLRDHTNIDGTQFYYYRDGTYSPSALIRATPLERRRLRHAMDSFLRAREDGQVQRVR